MRAKTILCSSRRRFRPNNAPIVKPANLTKIGYLLRRATRRQQTLASEAQKWCVGPMDVDGLLRSCFSGSHDTKGKSKERMPMTRCAFSSVPENKDSKDDGWEMCEALCDAINKKRRCPSFRFVHTHSQSDNRRQKRMKPGLCLYKEEDMTEITDNVPNLGSTELFVEYRKSQRWDPFNDPTPGTRKSSHQFVSGFFKGRHPNKALRTVGQMASYAAEICARQHRTHCFSICIYGPTARIIRWDRSGAIVSRSFNYHDNPKLLCQFLWQYSRATDSERGFDTTVQKASPKEEAIFLQTITEHIQSQVNPHENDLPELISDHYEKGCVFKVPVHPDTTCEIGGPNAKTSACRKYNTVQYFLVSRPVAAPSSIHGNSARGYWAVKVPDAELHEDYCIAFLKDTWRIAGSETQREGEIMVELVEAGVPYVSDVLCHGDVEESVHALRRATDYQYTLTDRYRTARWNYNITSSYCISPRVHYRMALVEVGYPLKYLTGTTELLHATYTAFIAAWEALKRCKRIHRDISVNNIILVKKEEGWRSGVLIDWEISTRVDESGKVEDFERMGTWPFMSIKNLTGKKGFRHTFSDDTESFFYVVLYAAALWVKHEYVEDLGGLMEDYFNEYRYSTETTKGGSRKAENILYYDFVEPFKWSGAISEWIFAILDLQKNAMLAGSECSPEKLAEIWETTLRKDLPKDDRQVHQIDSPDDESEEEELSSSDIASLNSEQSGDERDEAEQSETISSRSKRSVDSDSDEAATEDDSGSGNKRLRRSARIAHLKRQRCEGT